MADLGQARQFAQTMARLGEAHGVRTAAMITAMDTPLGRAVGNAVEVREALDVLGECGPGDVRDLVIAGAEAMLRLAGIGDPAEALTGGRALDKFGDMIRAPGRRPQPAAHTGAGRWEPSPCGPRVTRAISTLLRTPSKRANESPHAKRSHLSLRRIGRSFLTEEASSLFACKRDWDSFRLLWTSVAPSAQPT